MPYVTGGLGDRLDRRRSQAVAAAGADAVEIGIPFSDPVMDGPTIQEASQRALDRGRHAGRRSSTRSRGVDVGVPLVAMTYYNLVFRTGHRRFARLLADAGRRRRHRARPAARGAATTGRAAADDAGVETVLLAAPVTPDDRLARICRAVAGLRLRREPDGRDRRARRAGRVGRRCWPSGSRRSPTSRC